jgi:hypothetical protein
VRAGRRQVTWLGAQRVGIKQTLRSTRMRACTELRTVTTVGGKPTVLV